eukprot:GFYU01029437.1.p1 GENE.GFYU01029437.1~~GFYU01029437.1.p1  ORF type:complete len:292 (-),score=68.06 GFYU01029437.1:121-894(-)
MDDLKQIDAAAKFMEQLKNCRDWVRQYPQYIAGIDLAGEETDTSGISEFLSFLVHATDESPQDIPLYLHAGETWSTTNRNLLDAISFGSRRIGHGFSIVRYGTGNLRMVAKHKIAFEVCPISNQLLGYVPDVRGHPALEILQAGIPISIGVDDPLLQGYRPDFMYAYDWLAIYLSWPIDLSVMKSIAVAGIEYSSLELPEKNAALYDFSQKWNQWLRDALAKLAYMDLESPQYDPNWYSKTVNDIEASMLNQVPPPQ